MYLACWSTVAQQPIENRDTIGKVVEIVFENSTRPPIQLALKKENSTGVWSSQFPKINGWQPPKDSQTIQAVNFDAQLVENKVRVRISVFTGKRFRENDDLVAEYFLGEDEMVRATDLARFGIVPYLIRIVTVVPLVSDIPAVTNKTQSVQAIVSPMSSSLPMFRARLVNSSPKPVLAVAMHTMAGERRLISGMPHGTYGRQLILPNESYDLNLKISDSDPASGTVVTLYIDAIVFGDGSFEGNPEDAARFRGFMTGRKYRLSKLVPVMKASLQGATESLDLDRLISRIGSEMDEVDEAVITKLLSEFVSFNAREKSSVRGAVKVASDGIITSLTAELRKLRDTDGTNAEALRQGLLELTQHHQEWLDRLSK